MRRMSNRAMPVTDGSRGEIYFEFIPVGTVVKVTAIDAATGVEVAVMGPAGAKQTDLKRLALQKLKAQLARAPG
jgi:hypothetical protein